MLDTDLAELYGVSTKALNQAVKRNVSRFPSDFMFRLSAHEAAALKSETAGAVAQGRGRHRKYLPYVFTEQGAGMLASVLHHPGAVSACIEILRAFARVRRGPEAEVDSIDQRLGAIFAAIRDAAFLRPEDKPYTTDVPCTYFIRAGEHGPIKIGATKNLVVRLRTLCAVSPVPLRLLGVMEDNAEERCHALVGASRLHGEWFAPSTEILQFIQEYAVVPATPSTRDVSTRTDRR